MKNRCPWPADDALMIKYHDEEWGIPVHDDRKLFEFMVLDAFQAGLSWKTILHKREAFRKAFDNFEPKKVAKYSSKKISELIENQEIIRNRQKIAATIKNAQCFLEVQKEYGSFDTFIWQFTRGKTKINRCIATSDIAVNSSESDAMSRELKRRGFSFVGSTICYAFMQAAGMVNDHLISCFRYEEIKK
ncbi:MAG: DNA-3-methyladenine glycosylase I [Bacteroidales bacterium]|jgi:DNA-3-methyladenine glycosylase I|nr:DNA-3-methyladenine glycosylase I [Bacteroidales bacterium]MDD4215018.1 DNA-3-methyladenine glycosylase I [Bacteroidales bacterium]